MFHILSKILAVFVSPFSWFFILLILSLIVKKSKLKKIFLISAIAIIYIFSNNFIFNSFVKLWDDKPVSEKNLKNYYDYGIVLGGLASYNDDFKMINFHEASDRLLYAIKFYKEGKIGKIIISGGSAKLINNEIKEGDIIKEYMLSIEIPEEDIIIENQSRNSYENAKFTSELLSDSKDTSDFILFTSALHMKRAAACFKKQNINPDRYSVDYHLNKSEYDVSYFLVPKINVIDEWSLFLHEIIGYYTYKMKKYI